MVKENMAKDEFRVEQDESCFKKDISTKDCSKEEDHQCKARVINEAMGICPSTLITPTPNIPITVNTNVVVKIPVVLAEATITIPVVSTIRLESKASEIKRIRKNVFIRQCHLIPGTLTPITTPPTTPITGILNIAGFVRKNIEFVSKECIGKGVSSGRILDTTVEVPFNCTATVTFTIRPVFTPNVGPSEIETFQDTLRTCDSCAENLIGSNPCERSFSQTEVFNERVFCELVSAAIFESNINLNPSTDCHFPTEQTFNEFTEKMVVNVTLKLLQNQQVRVTALV
jgi:hypothetical protein